jgi:hypothetical protein
VDWLGFVRIVDTKPHYLSLIYPWGIVGWALFLYTINNSKGGMFVMKKQVMDKKIPNPTPTLRVRTGLQAGVSYPTEEATTGGAAPEGYFRVGGNG